MHRQGVFEKQRIHRLDRLGHLNRAGGIQLVVAVHGDVDLVPDGIAGVLEPSPDAPDLFAGEGRRVAGAAEAADGIDADLKSGEALGRRLDAGRPVPQLGFV